MNLSVINGPNLNLLGIREAKIYGKASYFDLIELIKTSCSQKNINVDFFQSNHEGNIIDYLQSIIGKCDGIIINPGGLCHSSVSIRDAIAIQTCPIIEVHISNIYQREEFRHKSITGTAATGSIIGLGVNGYLLAIDAILELVNIKS